MQFRVDSSLFILLLDALLLNIYKIVLSIYYIILSFNNNILILFNKDLEIDTLA